MQGSRIFIKICNPDRLADLWSAVIIYRFGSALTPDAHFTSDGCRLIREIKAIQSGKHCRTPKRFAQKMKTDVQENILKDWPHAPVHRLNERGAYMVTCGCYQKLHHLNTPERLTWFQNTLFEQAERFQWQLQAWAILSNHYHFVATSPEDPQSLRKFVTALHRITAIELNTMDDVSERKVWYQYYDSRITYQKSYLARLRYVHENAVHHGVVDNALDYPWCSAIWLRKTATSSFRNTLASFKIDKLKVMDDF